MKEEIGIWIKTLLATTALIGLPVSAWVVAHQEVRSQSHQFVWTGKGWKVSDASSLPTNIDSPYGFLHNDCLVGQSYTLVVPLNRMGLTNKVRVHIW
jgi:hypothetical protein